MIEARFYKKIEDGCVRCFLCAHRCKILNNRKGICGVRENLNGRLYTHIYGKVISRAVDPIEKKPLFHFYPASMAYSIATPGCNFRCLHCQNYQISQVSKTGLDFTCPETTPEEIVADAIKTRCSSIAYTYTEPTIFMEYAYDTARLADAKGIKNVFVTNGYMTKEALKTIKPYLHGVNADLKSFNDKFYRRVCGARLAPVLDSIRLMKDMGIWVEITTLIIPTMNDKDEELLSIARWIKETDPSTPWHISAFYPVYKLSNLSGTPLSTVERARRIGLDEGLKYVYTGNMPGNSGENTYCHSCGKLLIERTGFYVMKNHIKDSKCPCCKSSIDGIGL